MNSVTRSRRLLPAFLGATALLVVLVGSSRPAQAQFFMELTPSARTTPAPSSGFIHLQGVTDWGATGYWRLSGFVHKSSSVAYPYAYYGFTVPADGWYVVNHEVYISSYLGAKLTIYHGQEVVAEHLTPEGMDAPVLLYLTAGRHYMKMVVEPPTATATTYNAALYAVTVSSIP